MKNALQPESLDLELMLATLCQTQQWSGEHYTEGNLFSNPSAPLAPDTNHIPLSVRETLTWLDVYQRDSALLFLTAVLITGAIESAEAAVQDSVNLVGDLDPDSRAALTAVAAIAVTQTASFDTEARLLLPEELRSVADLPRDLRICFVLRRLAGLTAREAAELIGMRPSEIDRRACNASVRLAQRSLHVD